jgi:hypothetical protein
LEQLFTPPVIAIIVGIVIVAGVAHGTLGFGFPLISTPLVALLVDIKTAVLLTVVPNIVVNLISIVRGGRWRESLGRHWPLAVWVTLGTLVGTRLPQVGGPSLQSAGGNDRSVPASGPMSPRLVVYEPGHARPSAVRNAAGFFGAVKCRASAAGHLPSDAD